MSMVSWYPATVARMLRRLLVAALAALALVVAAATALAAAPNPPQPRPVVEQFYDSGAWARDTATALKTARRDLLRGLKHVRKGAKPAIVLDIDDTSLTQYPCRKPGDLPFDDGAKGVECVMSSTLPAIAPTRSFYRLAQRKKVRVFFITGRGDATRDATVANLRLAGFTGKHTLILRPASTFGPSVVPYKSGERKRLVRAGYDILVNVGDQLSDLEGGAADRRVKVPNPMYLLP
jgi:acid phosphatase